MLVKTANLKTGDVHLFAEATRGEGERVWMEPTKAIAEAEIDAYIDRRTRLDPDLWVVEIQDEDGRRLLTEPVDES